jgi:L-seryl-tRNA(Ser) seleniumtransferase
MVEPEIESLLSQIPQIDQLLREDAIAKATKNLPRKLVVEGARKYISELRETILKEKRFPELSPDKAAEYISKYILDAVKPQLSKVINATGIIIHTNLGRSPLSENALSALKEAAESYCLLEIDPDTGERTHRIKNIEPLLCQITGAESATVVNNDAAAVMLTLSALARAREVICSRGEMVEIGGSFRLPEIVQASGVKLVGVGTTNRTYLSDYENAITEQTAALLKVHRSNFEIVGFTSSVPVGELSALGRRHGVPVVYDLGSGALVEIDGEVTVAQAVRDGADIITFSADKLLGGPQAGIILGAKKYIEIFSKHPLARAVRAGKLTLSALEATLKLYLDPQWAKEQIPALRMMFAPVEKLRRRAKRLVRLIEKEGLPVSAEVVECESQIGGGTTAGRNLPSYGVAISGGQGASRIAQELRAGEPHIFTITRDEAVIFDVRTLERGEEKLIVKRLAEILRP